MHTLKTSDKKCILIGEGSIARFCLELLQKKHFEISCLITGDVQLQHWAESQAITVLPWKGEKNIAELITDHQYSLILSAGNLYQVPEPLLRLNNALAINIHDGPMQNYLGFNTPAWALLDQQTQHQINWHIMTPDLYKGAVLSSQAILIEHDETAMTLNAKCFTAALNSLDQLLDDLAEPGITLKEDSEVPQQMQTIYSRQQRPAYFGFINPNNTVENILTQIRALDFGHHENPLCLAKAAFGHQIFHVTAAHLEDDTQNYPVGHVISCINNKAQVQCSNGIIELELASLSVLKPELQLSKEDLQDIRLPFADQLESVAQHFGRHESFWQKQLKIFSPLSIPYIDAQLLTQPVFSSHELQLQATLAEKLMTVLLYFSRLCDQSLFSVPLILDESFAGPDALAPPLDKLGSARQAFSFKFDFERPVTDQKDNFNHCWNQLMAAGNFSADLIKRTPELHQWQASIDQPYALFVSDDTDADLKQKFKCFTAQSIGIVLSPATARIRLISNGSIIKSLAGIAREIEYFASRIAENALTASGQLSIVTPEEQALLQSWSVGPEATIDALLFDRLETSIQAHRDKNAVIHRSHKLSYADLEIQINQVKSCLKNAGVQQGNFVGIMMPRSLPLLPCLLGVMAYGAACVPMDPLYPQDRLDYVIENSKLKIILCLEPSQVSAQARQITWSEIITHKPATDVTAIQPSDLAYMLYTSGSSGKPKGVMVEHGNLSNFFIAMDQNIPLNENSVWLAVTSISFDISLLELLWTLTRGITVVLYDGQDIQTSKDQLKNESQSSERNTESTTMDFGLFFWNISNEHDKPGSHQYELLLKASEYGDLNGFSSVWTPERHFGDFGGLYPNPAITSAAVASCTRNIHIRAGSCVFPLHHPIRIAEDWSMIDNISNGRVGLSAAPGWMPNDFVIMPENYAKAKDKMFENLDTVRKLWRGDKVTFDGPKGPIDITTLPRPVQKELPVWITTGGNPENFRTAGEMGVNLLTHLLGQTVEDLTDKIRIYREAWAQAGHAGQGTITVMLHTFVGQTRDQARDTVRAPMKNYLKTALFLVKAAAWDWPLFKKLSESQSQNLDDFFNSISDEDMDALLDFAFERYFKTSGLFGNEQDCIAFARTLHQTGVNEIGCLIDFGIDTGTVLNHLPLLKNVLDKAQSESLNAEAIASFGVAALIERHHVTHLQVTPSMARLFLSDQHIADAMKNLNTMLVGGEALPLDLARTLKDIIQGPLLNMYGPTETTIWSSVSKMDTKPEAISLGHAIANTQISIVDSRKQPMPVGAIGELFIGGAGVVRGYWQREDLTVEKFLEGYPDYSSCEKVYATGDLARYLPDGRLLFLGRNDFQVKVRGYRIEPGEIETVLLKQSGISEAVVHPVIYSGAEPRLVGYYTRKTDAKNQEINSNQLKQALAAELPGFMVPNLFVELSTFPLTPNAKIDRKALPVPKQTAEPVNSENNALDASETELKVLEIWRDILGTDQFGLDDNFFDHGGHSLLVVDVMTRVRPLFEKQIKLIDLFRFPQVRKLVKHLSSESEASDTNVVANAQNRAAARRAARRRQ